MTHDKLRYKLSIKTKQDASTNEFSNSFNNALLSKDMDILGGHGDQNLVRPTFNFLVLLMVFMLKRYNRQVYFYLPVCVVPNNATVTSVSRLRAVDSVIHPTMFIMSQCGKLEINALVDRYSQ